MRPIPERILHSGSNLVVVPLSATRPDPGASIATAYGVDVGLPVNAVVDRAGRAAPIFIGETPISSIESAVQRVVAPAAA